MTRTGGPEVTRGSPGRDPRRKKRELRGPRPKRDPGHRRGSKEWKFG